MGLQPIMQWIQLIKDVFNNYFTLFMDMLRVLSFGSLQMPIVKSVRAPEWGSPKKRKRDLTFVYDLHTLYFFGSVFGIIGYDI